MSEPIRSRSSGVVSRPANARRKSYMADDDERRNIVVSGCDVVELNTWGSCVPICLHLAAS